MPPKAHNTVTVQVDVVVSMDPSGKVVEEYWNSVTPMKPLLFSPATLPVPAPSTIVWELRVSDLATGLSVNPSRFLRTGGIVMNKNASAPPVWDDAWGVPTRVTDKRFELVVPVTANPGVAPFKYSVVVDVKGTILTIDPEVEFDN